MTCTFFTSDTHFGHRNIIRFAMRPFETVEEMDEAMIANWNAVVGKGDRVFHLGDFSFVPADPILERLNGEKHLILGNHDYGERIGTKWASVESLRHLRVEGVDLVLCHYAMRVWRGSHRGAVHLFGHSHGNLIGDRQCCDVGVDAWDYEPVPLASVLARLARHSPRTEPDHHKPKGEQA
jgi:calcineurin-like phosphoesterase family protein